MRDSRRKTVGKSNVSKYNFQEETKSFQNKYFHFTHIGVLSVSMCVHPMHGWYPWKEAKKGHRILHR